MNIFLRRRRKLARPITTIHPTLPTSACRGPPLSPFFPPTRQIGCTIAVAPNPPSLNRPGQVTHAVTSQLHLFLHVGNTFTATKRKKWRHHRASEPRPSKSRKSLSTMMRAPSTSPDSTSASRPASSSRRSRRPSARRRSASYRGKRYVFPPCQV